MYHFFSFGHFTYINSLFDRYLAGLVGYLDVASEIIRMEGVIIYDGDSLEILMEIDGTQAPDGKHVLENIGIELYRYKSYRFMEIWFIK